MRRWCLGLAAVPLALAGAAQAQSAAASLTVGTRPVALAVNPVTNTVYVAVQVDTYDTAPDLDRTLPVPEDWSVLVERAQLHSPTLRDATAIQQMQQQ